jgi:hypothetical protein
MKNKNKEFIRDRIKHFDGILHNRYGSFYWKDDQYAIFKIKNNINTIVSEFKVNHSRYR